MHIRALRYALVLTAAVLAVLAPSSAMADRVGVRAGEIDSGARIILDWPSPVGFRVEKTVRKVVVLTFDRPIDAEIAALSSSLPRWIRSARILGDGAGISLVLHEAATVRSFASGGRVVIDLAPAGDPSASLMKASEQTVRPPQKQGDKATGDKATNAQETTVTNHETVTNVAPAAGAGARPVSPPPSPTPSKTTTTTSPQAHQPRETGRAILAPAPPVPPRKPDIALERAPEVPPVLSSQPDQDQPENRIESQIEKQIENQAGKKIEEQPEKQPENQPAEKSAQKTDDESGDRTHRAATSHGEPVVPPAPSLPSHEQKQEAATHTASPEPAPQAQNAVSHNTSPESLDGQAPLDAREPLDRQESFLFPSAEITFAQQPTPIALFRRGVSLFLVISGSGIPDTLPDLVGEPLARDARVSLVPSNTGRVIRIDLADKTLRSVSPILEATERGWRVSFATGQKQSVTPLPVKTQREYTLGARLLIEGEMGTPVVFKDPVVGDLLSAIPVKQPAHGFPAFWHLEQVRLLPTLQGAAVVLRADGVSVVSTPDGVEVTMAGGGLKLAEGVVLNQTAGEAGEPHSPAHRTNDHDDRVLAQAVSGKTLDFALYPKPTLATFVTQRQKAEEKIIAAQSPEERAAAQVDLARLYFINGMASEASAIWSLAARNDSAQDAKPEYVLYRSVAAITSGALDTARTELATLERTADTLLWGALLDARGRDWPKALEQFKAAQTRLYDYPDPYLTRMQNAFVEAALAMADTETASTVLAAMVARQRTENAQKRLPPASDYLTGLLAWQEERPDEARAHFGTAAKSWNYYWRVRSDLALLDADLSEKKIGAAEALRRLERLRFAWRGDALEFDMLYTLSGLYAAASDYPAAFESYARLANRFPEDPRTPSLKGEQQALFARIFQGEERDKIPAFSQLALWDGYADFRPTQPDILNDVVLYLARRSAEIDLVDRAVGFYQDVLARTNDPAARARLGAQAAGVLLLDGTIREAEGLLDVTEPKVEAGTPHPLPVSLKDERRMLRARVLYRSGKPEEALALLANDYSDPAMRLRADITWGAKRWGEAAAVFAALLGNPPAQGVVLNEEQRQLVLRRAIALALDGDRIGLAELREQFTPFVIGTPDETTFQLLTRPESLGGAASREAILKGVAEVDLFQQFLERYRGGNGNSN